MAISAPHHHIMREIQSKLPRGGSLLEIGEANWYGDIPPDFPFEGDQFAAAKAMYRKLFAPDAIVSIDQGGTPDALKFDLNCEISIPLEFDVVINHGTAEHIFNIAQVFKTAHDHCAVGGLMIHESPFTGWIDHGFYCLQPTLFYDLASANCYEVSRVYVEDLDNGTYARVNSRDDIPKMELPKNGNLFVVFRKHMAGAFRIPLQGYYAKTLSEAGKKAWEDR